MRKTAKQGKLNLGTGQRVGLQGPHALTPREGNNADTSHENQTHGHIHTRRTLWMQPMAAKTVRVGR